MTAINLDRLRRGPRWTRQPIPPRLASARAGWYHPGVFATVVPTAAGWTVYEVLGAGMGYADTSFHQRRSYRTLVDAMAAAERRNAILRRREAEREASMRKIEEMLGSDDQIARDGLGFADSVRSGVAHRNLPCCLHREGNNQVPGGQAGSFGPPSEVSVSGGREILAKPGGHPAIWRVPAAAAAGRASLRPSTTRRNDTRVSRAAAKTALAAASCAAP